MKILLALGNIVTKVFKILLANGISSSAELWDIYMIGKR